MKNLYFCAYVTNLGKYNEGELVGEWIQLPTTAEDFAEALKRIGIGSPNGVGGVYEEWFVSDYDSNLCGFNWSHLGEFPNFEALQGYGDLVASVRPDDVEAIENIHEFTGNIAEAIEKFADSSIAYFEGVYTPEDFAHYCEDTAEISRRDYADHIDFGMLGRDLNFDDYFEMLDEAEQERLEAQGVDYFTAKEFYCGDPNVSDYELGQTYFEEVGGAAGIYHPELYFDYKGYGEDTLAWYTHEFTPGGLVIEW